MTEDDNNFEQGIIVDPERFCLTSIIKNKFQQAIGDYEIIPEENDADQRIFQVELESLRPPSAAVVISLSLSQIHLRIPPPPLHALITCALHFTNTLFISTDQIVKQNKYELRASLQDIAGNR